MPRGFFTQSIAILLERPVDASALAKVLDEVGIQVVGIQEEGDKSWFGGPPEAVVSYRPELNGYVSVDIVDSPWPDHMGDPQGDVELFAAWTMGSFGPGAFPGNLERAVLHQIGWDAAAGIAERHRAFARARVSYVLGAGEDAPVFPEGADSLHELWFLTELGAKLMALPGALAFFNPNAEVLISADILTAGIRHAREHDLPPLQVATQIRFANIGDAPGWALMDTVGLEQLFLPDQEACFEIESVDADDVATWLLNVGAYLVSEGPVVRDGHTIDGPGGTWRCSEKDESLQAPPRNVLRWMLEGSRAPSALR